MSPDWAYASVDVVGVLTAVTLLYATTRRIDVRVLPVVIGVAVLAVAVAVANLVARRLFLAGLVALLTVPLLMALDSHLRLPPVLVMTATRMPPVARLLRGNARHWYVRRLLGALGGPGWSLDEIRAEYAQMILKDAETDPVLNALLDEIAGRLDEALYSIHDAASLASRDGRLMAVTLLANRCLDRTARYPERGSDRPYLGYSFHMLRLAACCRLADRQP